MPAKLLIATKNKSKLREYRELLDNYNLELLSLDDIGVTNDIAETGSTIEENARLKALAYFKISGLPTLADDTSVEIEALVGWPGVYVRRIWGPNEREATDDEIIEEVLKRMASIPQGQRGASFVTLSVLVMPDGSLREGVGRDGGVMVEKPSPLRSPGYPFRSIMYLNEFKKLAVELDMEGRLSEYLTHRKQAIMKLEPYLKQLENYA